MEIKKMKIERISTSFLYEGNIMLEIFISGCKHKCKGCYNQELWDFEIGEEMTIKQILDKIKEKIKWIDGIVLTGGDPLWNVNETMKLTNGIKWAFPKLKIWMYTGFTKEEIDISKNKTKIFNDCDVIITDRYIDKLSKTNLTGSSNQRIWKNKNDK